MAMLDLRADFRRFRAASPRRINLAAHSHHDWPDVSYDAQIRCWDDAARLANKKWEYVLDELSPSLQKAIAALLNLPDPRAIAFSPNTHAFVGRILSCFPPGRPVRILTTDAEFHSFRRQVARLEEDGMVSVTRVPAEPFASFPARFRDAAASGKYDLVFVSQVFFTSGATCGSVEDIVAAVPDDETFIVIDGYHGFMARPIDLSRVAARIFYMAGGYKYAMAGEGICLMHCPPAYGARPRDTGWYAEFGALEAPPGKSVGYPADGTRFLGATFDPVGMYRLDAVLAWLASRGLGVEQIHAHATALMAYFLNRIEPLGVPGLMRHDLITPFGDNAAHGNFLTFGAPDAAAIIAALSRVDIQADHRGNRLRFGFGIALTVEEVDVAVERMTQVLRRR